MIIESSDTNLTEGSTQENPTISTRPLDVFKEFDLPTGLVYDIRLHYHDQLNRQKNDIHPENPLRVYKIFRALQLGGCLAKMKRLGLREVTDHELLQVHTPAHIEFMKSLEGMTKPELVELTQESDSVYFNAVTNFCARLSCGGVIELLKEITLHNVRNGMAVVRPPDVHHGNGIQDAFYDDENVLYISLHRYMEDFYPQTGKLDDMGTGRGIGKNVNIPFTTTGMGDGDYLFAFQHVVMPIALEFNPDLVVVACGFDAAKGDPIGEFAVSPMGYAHMTHLLKGLADGRLAICLEGGYDLDAISRSALAVGRVLLGVQPDPIGPLKPSVQGAKDVMKVVRAQAEYWSSLQVFASSLNPKSKPVA